jgi:hypothetical protein
MTISSTAITIHGPTAWLVVRSITDDLKYGTGRRRTLDVECDNCEGDGFDIPEDRSTCWNCNGVGTYQLSVHVVEVLPIVERDGSIGIAGRLVTHHVTTGLMGSSVTTSIWDGIEHLKFITLPADAAPGMYAVRLAVHT